MRCIENYICAKITLDLIFVDLIFVIGFVYEKLNPCENYQLYGINYMYSRNFSL